MTLTHARPVRGSGRTPCCDRVVSGLPAADRVTEFGPQVTCRPPRTAYDDTVAALGFDPIIERDARLALRGDILAGIVREGTA